MKSVYLGTDAFSASVLGKLVEAGRTPDLVVTKPDSKQGRGRRLAPPPTAVTASELGLGLIQPQAPGDPEVLDAIDVIKPDVICLCAYGALIREPLLSDHVILNLHPSLLPRWRGAAPIERALMAGDSETGVSIIRLVEALDAGPVCLAERVSIGEDADFATLSSQLEEVGARLLGDAMERHTTGELDFVDQAADGVTYAERIEAADRLLDPGRDADDLERTVRALRPHIGARLVLPSGEAIGVRESRVSPIELERGALKEVDGEVVLGCSEGSLAISRVVPSGGREMASADWLRGRPALD